MAEFILNPRRAVRAPARCRAAVASPAGWFEAETEDIGSMGCQIVSPRLVKKGELLQLVVSNEKVSEKLLVNGRVAWVSEQAPWRVGISFDELSRKESARWFERLISAYPGLAGYRRVPERIRSESMVYLGAPPRFLLDFTSDEAALLRAIGSGARVDEIVTRLRDREAAGHRALFSLIARQAITFERGQAAHPDSWKKILSEVEASLAVESLGSAPLPVAFSDGAGDTPLPRPTPPPPERTATPAPGRATPLPGAAPSSEAQPAETPAAHALRGSARGIDAAGWTDEPRRSAHGPDFVNAGVGWRRPPAARSPEAQAAFDRAVEEIRAGSVNGAIAHLRRALSLAPGDPEIADALGKLAFKDRKPGPP